MHSHKMQPQPIDECISTLAAILAAPRERVPAVVTVFAQPPAQTTAQTSDKQVCKVTLHTHLARRTVHYCS